MRKKLLLFTLLCLLVGACANSPENRGTIRNPLNNLEGDQETTATKITFDLTELDEDGLRGPPTGKVSVSYEFCIPDTPECRRQVKTIDPSVRFSSGSRGRIGCTKSQCLCIGGTHQPHFRTVLQQLAALPYIERIDQCFFE